MKKDRTWIKFHHTFGQIGKNISSFKRTYREREDKLPLCIAVRNGCIYGNLLLGYIFHQSRAYYGLSACEYRDDDLFYQWDYPCMWPAATCLAYMGLKNLGLNAEAARIAGKYVSVAGKIFEETGRLWEKYDALTGKIAVTIEYDTMPMMGWTAAV